MLRFYLFLITLAIFPNFATADLPLAKNFFADAQQARKNKSPILIMFSIPDCEYCQKIKEDVISPMVQLKEYQDKIIIRHIEEQSFDKIYDFYNVATSHNKFAFKYAVNFFPTVILVDNYGTELEKIIGVPSEEYYWADLDRAIKQASKKIQQQPKTPL